MPRWLAGLLLSVAVLASCREASIPAATESPSGVRTPLPALSDAPACAAQPAESAAAAPPATPVKVVTGNPGEPAPVDEIPFSHKAHAGDCGIPCLTCHTTAESSPVAGLPSGQRCMGCHKFVAKQRPAIQVLAARVRAGQPLRWSRVFELPDFVYFTHRVHLHFREPIECKQCHGDVAAMKVVRQEEPFTMGRCLTCHEDRNVRHDCVVCHR